MKVPTFEKFNSRRRTRPLSMPSEAQDLKGHDASGGYYGTSNVTVNGHPSDTGGFAVSGGFTLNDILGFKGDTSGMQACYSEGAAGYCTRATSAWQMYSSGNNAGFGWVTDGVYDNECPGKRPIFYNTTKRRLGPHSKEIST